MAMYYRLLFALIFWGATHSFIYGQILPPNRTVARIDTVKTDTLRKGNGVVLPVWPQPKKAVYYSLLLPGAGQIYNKSYWKTPIVYLALGTCVYFVVVNHHDYMTYKTAYSNKARNRTDNYSRYTAPQLLAFRDFYRRNRDFSIILLGLGYALTAIEAYTDAHLKHFSVSDNLTLSIRPTVIDQRPSASLIPQFGLKLGLHF